MNLAINYSTQAADLVERGKIEVDRFKCPDWPGLIAEIIRIKPVAVHFSLSTTNQSLGTADWKKISQLLEETETPFINLHLWTDRSEFPGLPVGDFSENDHKQVVADLIARVREVGRRFGAQRVILENVPYRGKNSDVLSLAVEPVVISQIVEETGCGLLLDIPHARITAHYLGIDERDYIAQLPVHQLRELHFTGLLKTKAEFADHHLAIQDEDWQILDWVLAQIRDKAWSRPWLLAFEYGGVGEKYALRSDPTVIARQVPCLHTRIKDL